MKPTKKLLFGVGFFGVSLAFLAANQSPASGYELSIYSGTPLLYWVGIGVSLLSAVIIIQTSRGHEQHLGIGIGAFSISSIAGLPYLRGYYYFGRFDPLNQLSSVFEVLSGDINTMYPGLHLFSGIITKISMLEPRQSLLLLTAIYVLCFILLAPLVTRRLSNDSKIFATAAIFAFLLLPVVGIRIPRIEPTPAFAALCLLPLSFYILHRYLTIDRWEYQVLALILFPAIIILHPQQALVLIGTLVTFSVITRLLPTTIRDSQYDRSK